MFRLNNVAIPDIYFLVMSIWFICFFKKEILCLTMISFSSAQNMGTRSETNFAKRHDAWDPVYFFVVILTGPTPPLPHPVLAQSSQPNGWLDPPPPRTSNGGRRGARAPPPPPSRAAAIGSAALHTVHAAAAPAQISPPPPPSPLAPVPRARRQQAGGGGGGAWRGGRVRGRGGVLLLGHLFGALAGGLPRAEHQG